MHKLFVRFAVSVLCLAIGGVYSLFVSAQTQEKIVENHSTSNTTLAKLPSLPEGVSDLSFNEFFKMPIGPLGLDPTEKLLSLNNKRVRVIGYMAQEDDPAPGVFMLTNNPVSVGEKADGMADDLPANTLFVHMPAVDADKILSYRPKPWVLTGILQVGNKEEVKSGRTSFVRLIMEQRDVDEATKAGKKQIAKKN